MEFQEIISLLDQNTIRSQQCPLPKQRYNGTMMLRARSRLGLHPEDEAVVFTHASVFNSFPDEFMAGRAFVVHLDEPIKPLAAKVNIVTVRGHAAWIDDYESLATEFRNLQRKKEQILMLTSLVNKGTTLKRLVDEIASIIEAPASILDNSLSFLAYSDDFPEWAAHGEETVTGMLPDDALNLLKSYGIVNPSKPFDLKVFQWSDASGETHWNHFAFIHSRDTIVGSVSFFSEKEPLRQSRIDMIPTIAQILSIQMQRNNAFLLNKSLFYTNLFQRLEEGSLSQSHEYLERRFSLFGYKLKHYLHIFVVDFSRDYLPSERVQPLAKRLHPHISNSVYTINKNNIVFLSSNDEISEGGMYDAEAVEEDLAGTSIVVGVSSVFIEAHRTPSYIKEAQRAISTGRRVDFGKRVYSFSDYRLDDIAASVTDSSTLYSYRYPPLMHVIDLDAQNNTHLAYTLYEYLQDPTHPADVAAKLFIHKNTLYYRLEKIREVMGHDFKDAETVACIQMTFHVLRIQHRFEKLVLRRSPEEDATKGNER